MKHQIGTTRQTLFSKRLQRVYQNAKEGASHNKNGARNDSSIERITSNQMSLFEIIDKTYLKAVQLAQKDTCVQEGSMGKLGVMDKLILIEKEADNMREKLKNNAELEQAHVYRIAGLERRLQSQQQDHLRALQQLEQDKLMVEQKLQEMQVRLITSNESMSALEHQLCTLANSDSSILDEPDKEDLLQVDAKILRSDKGEEREQLLLQAFVCRLEAAMEEAKGVVELKDSAIIQLENEIDQARKLQATTMQEVTSLREYISAEKVRDKQATSQLAESLKALKTENTTLRIDHEEQLSQYRDRLTMLQEVMKKQLRTKDAAYQALEVKHMCKEEEWEKARRDWEQSLHDCQESLRRQQFARVAEKAAGEASRNISSLSIIQADEALVKKDVLVESLQRKLKQLQVEMKQQHNWYTKRIASKMNEHDTLERDLIAEKQQLRTCIQELEAFRAEKQQQEKVLWFELGNTRGKYRDVYEENERLQEEVLQLKRTNQKQVESHTREISELKVVYNRRLEDKCRLIRDEIAHEKNNQRTRKQLDHKISNLCPRCHRAVASTSNNRKILDMAKDPQLSLEVLDKRVTNKDAICESSAQSQNASSKDTSSQQEQEISCLQERVHQLVHALAIANEQETLAKKRIHQMLSAQNWSEKERETLLTQLNKMKEENWSLNLALQVTENTNKNPQFE